MTNESNLKVVRAGWDELPGIAKRRIREAYKAKPEEYRVYADMRKGKRALYVHHDIPEKDVAGFVNIVTCTDKYFIDSGNETDIFMDYVLKRYGEAAHYALYEAQRKTARAYMENKARGTVEAAIPLIKRVIDDGACDEYIAAAAFDAGLDAWTTSKRLKIDPVCGEGGLYAYCMGYLMGLAAAGKAAGAAV